jgi:hypothetical protein
MVLDSDWPMLLLRSGATVSSLLFALVAFPACGSSERADFNNLGGSATTGGGTNGGSSVHGGAAGASGTDATGGTGGGSDVGSGGTSNGGEAGSGGAPRGGTGAGGGGSAGSAGSATRGCPSSAPSNGTPCPPTLAGLTCYYDDCGATGTKKKAACFTAIPEIGNPQQLWTVQTFPCEARDDCAAMTCPSDKVCVIMEGGARIGQCSSQSCGSGPIECNCVQGCHQGCVLSNAANDVTFTCNNCSDIRGCP